MNKNKNKIKVTFVGTNSEDVTGSMTLIEFNNKKILLEAGLFQSGSPIEEYKNNSRRLGFNPRDVDYIFIGHTHMDHAGMLPRLYAMGCTAKIIAPRNTSVLYNKIIRNSLSCILETCDIVHKEHGISTRPIYNTDDIENTLNNMHEYGYNDIIKLDDEVSFKFIPSGHVIASAQILLIINNNNHIKKFLYTSDLGNINLYKPYVTEFERCEKADLVIGECTYSGVDKYITQKYRDKDMEKIETVITKTVSDKGKVLIASFSFDRLPTIITAVYLKFKDNKDFDTDVYIDTPLGMDLCREYPKILTGEDLALWEDVMNWKFLHFVKSHKDSLSLQASRKPMVVIASSGFMDAGRSKVWAKSIIPRSNNHIIFIGFCNENSLAYKIKNPKKYPKIKIDRGNYKNRCGITDLKSFSSHMQKKDLLDYYSSINSEKIALVHSDFDNKCKFAKELQLEVSKKNNTSKVVPVNKSTIIYI